MQNAAWIGWLVRSVLSLVVVGAVVFTLRWIKGGKGNWGELWVSLASSVRRQAVGLTLAVAGCLLISTLVPLAHMGDDAARLVLKLLGAAWVLVTAWGAVVGVSIVVGAIQWKYDIAVEDNLLARRMHTRIKVLQRIVVVVVWIAAVAGVMMQFDRFRALGATLLASAGIVSIVLGISAQKTFGSMIAGIQLALSHPINLDDVVVVDGEWGRIEEISFTYVVVRIWDQRRLIVPVSYFLENPFQNWTRKSSDILGTVFLHLDYETPLGPLRDEARRLCESSGKLWDGKTCVVQVTEAGSEDMTVRILASSPDASKAWDLRCLLREGLIDFIRDNYPGCLPKRRVSITGDDAAFPLDESR